MSKCMTLADEAIEQKDTCKEIDAKDIVEFILEEALNSAVIFSDKGCNRIGDFNITEDFCQQFDEVPANSRNAEVDRINSERDLANKDLNLNSGETVDRFASLVTANENLEFILDSLPKKDDIVKNLNDCKIITEETLADNELRIENGQIHIERNRSYNVRLGFPDRVRHEFYEKKDVIKDEKIEIEYFNDGKLNKIYVPLNKTSVTKSNNLLTSFHEQGSKGEHIAPQETPSNVDNNTEESTQRPFVPFTTEELRQVWENANSSIVGGWDGDMSTQPEEVARIMEELTSVQVFSNSSADPNRPRTCEFGEENVKKMTKEIEEINFNQSLNTSEDLDPACHSDGQGDADLDTKSFVAKSKEGIEKSSKAHKDQEESSLSEDLKSKLHMNQSRDDLENSLMNDIKNEEISLSSQLCENQNETEEIMNEGEEENFERTRERTETPVKSPSIKPNTEEYLIQSESSSHRSININDSENAKNVLCSSSGKMDASLESEKEIDHRNRKIDNERSLYNSEDVVRSSSNGSSLEEKGCTATANTLNLKEEVNEEEKRIDDVKNDAPSLGPSMRNPTLGQCSPHPQKSDMTLRKSHKTNDLSLNGLELLTKSNDSENLFVPTEDSPSNLVIHSNNSSKSSEVLWNYDKDANPPSRGSESVISKIPQDLAALPDLNNDEIENFTKNSTRAENRNEKILETDSFTAVREIQVPCCNAHPLAAINREISDLEITTKSENYSPSTDSYQERLISDFEDTVNTNNKHPIPNNNLKEESQNLKELKNDEREEEGAKNGTDEINIKNEDLRSEYLTSHKEEEDNVLTNAYSSESTTTYEHSSSTIHQTFKLHSQKMYLGSDLEPTNFEGIKFVLTDSEEAFIDSTENVIQVIDPHDNSNDENFGTISFSLLNESADEGRTPPLTTDRVNTSDSATSSYNERTLSQTENILKRNIFSGMTTVGPMKNLDVDPKDLTGPEIDFGKMTRISSSRQLAKDIFPTNIKSTSSEKTLEDHDSDGESSMIMEGERLEIGSLINRDIASLTKVQKIKEVMSYHPKADDDFEDDDTLSRPRLDLKDVESMTDERYKMTDVNIPLLSFEMANSNSETDKEYLQGMHLVLSGNCFSNNPYYEDDLDEDSVQTYRNRSVVEEISSDVKKVQDVETSEFVPIEETRGKNENSVDDINGKDKSSSLSEDFSLVMDDNPEQINQANDQNSRTDHSTTHQKYGTLGSVFKKASSKVIHKEGDLFLRNSKSLPRDASRITTSDSIRSILEDCHTSATNVLKKSRSLLKNTQSIFKTMSQNRFGVQSSSTNLNRQRMTSSDTETNTESSLERKSSTFQWKEDLTKAKTLIKNKVGKTFKASDKSSSQESDPEISSENKDLRLAVRNEKNYRVDRAENFRKLLPKSPLIYRSQFVRSQMRALDNFSSVPTCDESGNQERNAKTDSEIMLNEENSEKSQKKNWTDQKNEDILDKKLSEVESAPFNDKTCEYELTWTGDQAGKGEAIQNQAEETPEYVVMETIQGLPTVDLNNYSYEIDHQKDEISPKPESFDKIKGNKDGSKRYEIEVSNFSQHTTTCSPFESDVEEDKNVVTTPSEKKIRAKNKKFTARFRSFWSSAFGKVKTSPKNKDPS